MRSGAHSSMPRSVVARNTAWARLVSARVTRYSTATEESITTGPARRLSRTLTGVAVTPDQRRRARDSATRNGAASLDIVKECRQPRGIGLEPALEKADHLSPNGGPALESPPAQRLVRIVWDVPHVQCGHAATLACVLACCNQGRLAHLDHTQ